MRSRRVAVLGLLASLAIILGYVESLIPIGIGVPGIKIGFANMVIVAVLYFDGAVSSLIISVIRVFLIGFMFGNMSSIIYSLAGALFSLFVMWGLKKFDRFSIVGVSAAGGASHNAAQIAVASVLLETTGIFYYLPVLFVFGIISGIIIGITGGIITGRLKGIVRQ